MAHSLPETVTAIAPAKRREPLLLLSHLCRDKTSPNPRHTNKSHLTGSGVLESSVDCEEIIHLDGQILDLGVYQGASTRTLAGIYPHKTIHGFDSFEGLPEDWGHHGKGSFGEVKGALPNVPDNVELHKGWFDDTLPGWLAQHNEQPISLLRVDCDLYSSTRKVLTVLRPLIRSGTWILFDELIGYRTWEDHEYKAFMEFVDETGFEFDYIAYGLTYTLVHLL